MSKKPNTNTNKSTPIILARFSSLFQNMDLLMFVVYKWILGGIQIIMQIF